MTTKSILLFFTIPFFACSVFAHDWGEHQHDIAEAERGIYKLQQELDVLVEKKKNTRDRARIEHTLQRIVEIHAELISLRKTMDTVRAHLVAEHPEKVAFLDQYDSRMRNIKKRKKNRSSPLTKKLDQLMIKVQLKFASFLKMEDKKQESLQVEQVIQAKEKRRKENDADVYLRRRSKIKMVK